MKEQFSIHSVCRICLNNLDSKEFYDVFLVDGLQKKLCSCTPLLVDPDDGFPKNICANCYNRLNDLHDFHKLCVESVEKFQDLLSQNTQTIVQCTQFDIENVDDEEHKKSYDEEPNSFDPLLSIDPKMEFIENEEEVFKLIEKVDKEVEVVNAEKRTRRKSEKDLIETTNNDNSNDWNNGDFSDDDDFKDDNDDDFKIDDETDSDDDDVPLAKRLTKFKKERGLGRNRSNDENKPKEKPKRKRIPAAERHLHRIIECKICHRKFKKNERYQNHMKYHNEKLPFKCEFEGCFRGFTTANGLRLHQDSAHYDSEEVHKCPEEGCGKTFSRARLLNFHLCKVHKITKELKEPKIYPCTECEKVFRCAVALKKHMYHHNGEELPFPCNICGKRFVINSALKEHLMRHAGIKKYVCPYCGVGKTTRQEWTQHINHAHTQEKKYQCEYCPHSTYNNQNLRLHVKVVHHGIKDYACQFCGKTFGKSNHCKMHEMTHTGEKRVECNVCGKKFLYPKSLTQHLKTHQKRVLRAIEILKKRKDQVNEQNADEAKETASGDISGDGVVQIDPDKLEADTKIAEELLKVCTESAAKPHKDFRRVETTGDLAGSSKNIPIGMVQMANYTLSEGSHVCDQCGAGFNGPANLKRHYRIVHEGAKDYACRYCEKRFAKAQTLRYHEMIHTGEKPQECTECGKRFIQTTALKRHMKIHTERPRYLTPAGLQAVEELQKQERLQMEKLREEQERQKVIAEAAKEKLLELQLQDNEMQKLKQELVLQSQAPDPRIKNELGEFPVINTSTMGTRE